MAKSRTSLTRYDAALRALDEASSVDDVKKIRDQAEAFRAYARQAKNRTLEIRAIEIRIKAERRIGEMIVAQKTTVGLNRGAKGSKVSGSVRVPVKDDRPTLAEVGIDKHLAHRARRLASIGAEDFQQMIDGWRARMERTSDKLTVHLLRDHEAERKHAELEKRENKLKEWNNQRPMEELEEYEQLDEESSLPEKYETLKQRYERMLRENWAAPGTLPVKYDTACKIVAEAMWRVVTVSGLISVPGGTPEFFHRELYDIAEKLDDRLTKLAAAHFASMQPSNGMG
jgi:hypothetical protein